MGNARITTHVLIWDSANGIRDLNDTSKVTILGVPAGQTWVFTCASTGTYWVPSGTGVPGIPMIANNDSGQICGTATVTINGVTQNRAFLLTPQ